MPQLYLVATPIGNLGDFSPRAVETLCQVDFILAEDTRVTGKLLQRFNIDTPMLSYHRHNFKSRHEQVLERLRQGQSGAIVSDAGMPCISDPGEELVSLCTTHEIEASVIPGPNAAICALALSGLSSARFTFEGFLSVTTKSRREHLAMLSSETRTMIFYEAPHKLKKTLEDFSDIFGENRKITLVREITKLFEEVIRTTLGEALSYFQEKKPKGEFVLVLEGASSLSQQRLCLTQAVQKMHDLVTQGIKVTDAAKQVALQCDFSKATLYRAYLTAHQQP